MAICIGSLNGGFAISTGAVNSLPTITGVPTSSATSKITQNINTTYTFTTLQINDVDASSSDTMYMRLTIGGTGWKFTLPTGYTVTIVGGGNNTSYIKIMGTKSQINNALNGLVVTFSSSAGQTAICSLVVEDFIVGSGASGDTTAYVYFATRR